MQAEPGATAEQDDCDHCYRHNHDFDHPCCECGAAGVPCPPELCAFCRLEHAECECDEDDKERRKLGQVKILKDVSISASLSGVSVRIGELVKCTTCNRSKAPLGRDVAAAAASGYCDRDCPGYAAEPHPGTEWPGENRGNDADR